MKRLFDFSFSLVLLLLFIPIFFILIITLYFNLGGSIFFVQNRPGLNGKLFEIYKFKTMLDAKDNQGSDLPDHLRMTKFGSFLRSTSLDEIPSLFNVLKGDMSLVGPRPLLVQYLPLYSAFQSLRHNVRPGITGWAQVNGRNSLSWDEKFKLDVWYVDNQSFLLDMKVILTTVKIVLLREGVSAYGGSAVQKFTGNEEI